MSLRRKEREFFATARPTSLLQRVATPEEVAALAVFVACGPASAVNGAALRVDAGVVPPIIQAALLSDKPAPAPCSG